MEKILEQAFMQGLKERYDNIFEQYYPGNSNGINEVNLTVNFCTSLVDTLTQFNASKSFATYELPIKKTERIDAVVFCKELSSVFFIESKKLKNSQGKYQESLKEDLFRMVDEKVRGQILKEEWKEVTNQYLVCLADHWLVKQERTEAMIGWFNSLNHTEKKEVVYNGLITDFSNTADWEEKYNILVNVYRIN